METSIKQIMAVYQGNLVDTLTKLENDNKTARASLNELLDMREAYLSFRHPSYYNGSFWECCKEEPKDAIGCIPI
jgi:hypothetical protein